MCAENIAKKCENMLTASPISISASAIFMASYKLCLNNIQTMEEISSVAWGRCCNNRKMLQEDASTV